MQKTLRAHFDLACEWPVIVVDFALTAAATIWNSSFFRG